MTSDKTAHFTTAARPKSARDNHSLLARATKTDIRTTVAQRMLSAREMNGYSQTEAATLFGYKSPAQLSLWEQRRRMPPLQMLVRASAIYRVSLDYLMGVSDEPDRDPASALRAQVLAGARSMFTETTERFAEVMLARIESGGPTLEIAYSMTDEGAKFHAAVKRFMELNAKKFENMLGGAPLAGMAERFEANCLVPARQQVERHCRLNAADANRLRSKTSRLTSDLFTEASA